MFVCVFRLSRLCGICIVQFTLSQTVLEDLDRKDRVTLSTKHQSLCSVGIDHSLSNPGLPLREQQVPLVYNLDILHNIDEDRQEKALTATKSGSEFLQRV